MKVPKEIYLGSIKNALNNKWSYIIYFNPFDGQVYSKKEYVSQSSALKAGKYAIKNFIKRASQ